MPLQGSAKGEQTSAQQPDQHFPVLRRPVMRQACAALSSQRVGLGAARLGVQRPYATAVDGPPSEKDTETARGLQHQGPVTEEYKKAKELEDKFEGWR